MRLLLVWLLAAGLAARAGVIQGVALEQATGLALARTMVRLDPVPTANGSTLRPQIVRTSRRGAFTFLGVPDGMYILTATRQDYAPTAYGQRRLGGYGTPIAVTPDSSLFADLRMVRMGAISGRVLDENGVGISGVGVIAYRARLPLHQAGRAESDDRGVYRIHGLDPGKYWIRSAASTLDDGTGLLPTFGPQSRDSGNARINEVKLDSETQYADVQPEIGSLFSLSGKVTCAPEPPLNADGTAVQATLTVSSETGRHTTQLPCNGAYRFKDLAPGRYQVFGQLGDNALSGFNEFSLERDSDLGSVQLAPSPAVQFAVTRAGQGEARIPVTLVGRRDDLSELDPPRAIKTPRDTLPAGRWDIQGSAGPGQYIESIGTPVPQQVRAGTDQLPSDFFRVLINRSGTSLRVVVGDTAGSVAGSVMKEGNPVPGVPVFLWPTTDETRRQLGGTRQMLSNTEGKYRFEGLPPGDYKMLATFDVSEIDEAILILANAVTVRSEVSKIAAADLALWLAP